MVGLEQLRKPALAAAFLVGASFSVNSQAALVTIDDANLNPSPGVYTTGGYYTDVLGNNIVTTGGGNAANVGGASGQNDDGYMYLNLGFDVTFYGTTYSSLYINNNGNVSFGAGISAYVPSGPSGAAAPIISPFFSDVDTRSSDVVYYNLTADQLVVTWNNVGWFNNHNNPTNSFQLVLRGDDYITPTGEGTIGFFYQEMNWTATDTNAVAATGFGDGAGNGRVLESSLTNNLHTVLNNTYIWFNADLTPTNPVAGVPVPASGLLLLLGLLAVGASRRIRR